MKPNVFKLHENILPFLIKAGMVCSLVAFTLTLPFVFYNFYKGEWFFGFLLTLVVSFNLWNAYRCYTDRYHEGANAYLFAPMIILSVSYAVYIKGIAIGLWAYLAIITFFYIVSEKKAVIYGWIFIALLAIAASQSMEKEIAIRFIITLTAQFLLLATFLHYVYQLHELLKRKAISDPMTRLLNRETLQKRVEHCFTNGSTSTLLMLDVDHFKRINDELGHAAGDGAIKSIAKMIKHFEADNVQSFRLGGEEFLMVFPEHTKEQVISIASDMQQYLRDNPILQPREYRNGPHWDVTCSFGIAESIENDTFNDWLNRVDAKLYQAKAAGRDRVCF